MLTIYLIIWTQIWSRKMIYCQNINVFWLIQESKVFFHFFITLILFCVLAWSLFLGSNLEEFFLWRLGWFALLWIHHFFRLFLYDGWFCSLFAGLIAIPSLILVYVFYFCNFVEWVFGFIFSRCGFLAGSPTNHSSAPMLVINVKSAKLRK